MARILVFSPHEDRAGRAVTLAAELAAGTGAPITILRVLEEGLRWDPENDRTARDIRALLSEAETRELEALADPLRGRGLSVDVRIAWGVPWQAITDLVDSEGFDLVVKPARGLNRAGRVFFGSTALHLFRKCACPVWVVGDDGRLPAKILAAVDPAQDPGRRRLAELIVRWARQIGRLAAAEVHVVSAWHAPGADALAGRIPQAALDEYVRDHEARASEALAGILASLEPPIPGEWIHRIDGEARDVLARFAEENGFDLVVIGTLGRAGVAGELLGETAEMVLRDVRSSVLTMSPRAATDGFGDVEA